MSGWRDDLEPSAVRIGLANTELLASEVALVSAAISLKRIADAIDTSAKLSDSAIARATGNAIAASINEAIKSGLSAPLNQYGEGIGEAIQGQLVRGQRGIDQYEGREG